MRLRMLIAAVFCAVALPTGASAAGPAGYCPPATVIAAMGPIASKHDTPTPATASRAAIDDPLSAIVPVVQYACSNNCRRRCYSASQSCRASRRTCQRRLSACIRRCGC